MRNLRYLTLFLASLLGAAVLFALPARSDARPVDKSPRITGCFSEVRNHLTTFQDRMPYRYTSLLHHGLPEASTLHGVVNGLYWNCPNGDKPDKIKLKWFDACVFFTDNEEHAVYAGTTFSVKIFDETGVINRAVWKVPDAKDPKTGKYQVQVCRHKDIPVEDERWSFLHNKPRMSVHYRIHEDGIENADTTDMFHLKSGNTGKRILPNVDLAVSKWHN